MRRSNRLDKQPCPIEHPLKLRAAKSPNPQSLASSIQGSTLDSPQASPDGKDRGLTHAAHSIKGHASPTSPSWAEDASLQCQVLLHDCATDEGYGGEAQEVLEGILAYVVLMHLLKFSLYGKKCDGSFPRGVYRWTIRMSTIKKGLRRCQQGAHS